MLGIVGDVVTLAVHSTVRHVAVQMWNDYENRVAVIALHKVGMPPPRIFTTLKPLQIGERFVYRAQAVKAVAARIRRNPVRTQSVMSREMAISRPTMSRVLNHDLGL